jgi:hypothetical protein
MLEQYLKELDRYRDFETEGNIDKFDEVLGKIAKLNDPMSIGSLVKYFDDDSDYHEVLFGIVHLVEEFDDHTYLTELLPSMPWMVENSPYWGKVLHYRILNSPATFNEYINVLPSLSGDVKNHLKKLLAEIKNEDVEFESRCNRLLFLM